MVVRGNFIAINTLKIKKEKKERKRIKKISNKQPNSISGEIRKRKIEPKVSRRKEKIKIREEVNEIENRKATEKIN